MKKFLMALVLGALLACGSSSRSQDVGSYLLETKGDSVFKLTDTNYKVGSGTGFSVQTKIGETLTLTNAHVCGMSNDGFLRAHYHDGSEQILRILKVSGDTDLCILERASRAPGLKLISKPIRRYQRLNVLGHPIGIEMVYASGYSITRSVITLQDEETSIADCHLPKHVIRKVEFFGIVVGEVCTMDIDSVSFSATTFPGNSGSPVLTDSGDVAGVVFAGNNRTNYGNYIPIDVVSKFLDSIDEPNALN